MDNSVPDFGPQPPSPLRSIDGQRPSGSSKKRLAVISGLALSAGLFAMVATQYCTRSKPKPAPQSISQSQSPPENPCKETQATALEKIIPIHYEAPKAKVTKTGKKKKLQPAAPEVVKVVLPEVLPPKAQPAPLASNQTSPPAAPTKKSDSNPQLAQQPNGGAFAAAPAIQPVQNTVVVGAYSLCDVEPAFPCLYGGILFRIEPFWWDPFWRHHHHHDDGHKPTFHKSSPGHFSQAADVGHQQRFSSTAKPGKVKGGRYAGISGASKAPTGRPVVTVRGSGGGARPSGRH